MIIPKPNILLISGSGQNTGKTTLICRLIEAFCPRTNIVAVKMTHHFYSLTYDIPKITENDNFIIYEEVKREMPKDSSRMLSSGADKVFFVISKKESMGMAMKELLEIFGPNQAIICESGGLADFYKPGLHLHLTGLENNNSKPAGACDVEVTFDGSTFSLDLNNIVFESNSWKLK